MSYNYATERDTLWSDEGQRLFVGIRDRVLALLRESGAITMGAAMRLPKGIGAAGSWEMMACVDRMVELGEIREIPTNGAGQDRIFVEVRRG